MEKERVYWILALSGIALAILGALMFLGYGIAKGLGYINTPLWITALPYLSATISIIGIVSGFIFSLFNFVHKMYDKFDKVDERFEKVNERFDKVNEKFEGVNGRLTRLETEFIHVNRRLDKLIT